MKLNRGNKTLVHAESDSLTSLSGLSRGPPFSTTTVVGYRVTPEGWW